MASTIGSRMVVGVVTGTGSAIDVALDWTPRKVELYNVTGNCQMVWVSGMAADSGQKIVDSGSGTTDISFVTSDGVTVTEQRQLQDGDRGFTIGADIDINVSAEILHYVAHE